MTKLSRLPVEPEKMGTYVNDLWSSFTLLENKEEVRGFLRELLTHTEMKMLAKRLQIAVLLLMGTPYNTIREVVRVQNSTIAKISNVTNISADGCLRKMAEKLIKIEAGKQKKRETAYHPKIFRAPTEITLVQAVTGGIKTKLLEKYKKDSAKRELKYTFGRLH